jgi:hypothetical protein
LFFTELESCSFIQEEISLIALKDLQEKYPQYNFSFVYNGCCNSYKNIRVEVK